MTIHQVHTSYHVLLDHARALRDEAELGSALFKILTKECSDISCPCCSVRSSSYDEMISHLRMSHFWGPVNVAEWLIGLYQQKEKSR